MSGTPNQDEPRPSEEIKALIRQRLKPFFDRFINTTVDSEQAQIKQEAFENATEAVRPMYPQVSNKDLTYQWNSFFAHAERVQPAAVGNNDEETETPPPEGTPITINSKKTKRKSPEQIAEILERLEKLETGEKERVLLTQQGAITQTITEQEILFEAVTVQIKLDHYTYFSRHGSKLTVTLAT